MKNFFYKKIKNENGSATILVFITVMAFIMILMASYIGVTTYRQAQLKNDKRIQEIYKADVDNVDSIYEELENKYRNPQKDIKAQKESLVFLEHFEDKNNFEGISNTLISSDEKRIGNGSLKLNNTDIVNTKDNFELANDFTIEFWIKLSDTNLINDYSPIIVVENIGGIWLGLYDNNKFVVRGYGEENYIECDAPKTNEWTHIAISRNNGNMYLFYDGELKEQVENTKVFQDGNMHIGNDGGTTNYTINSYIDELKINTQEGRYREEFIPALKETNDDSNIIYHFNQTTIINYTAELSTESKKMGESSGYFNNTYIEYSSVDNMELDGDFTIDFWANISDENKSTWNPIMVGKNTNSLWIGFSQGKFIFRSYSKENIAEIEFDKFNEWTHFAICRKDNAVYIFIDGKLEETIEYEDTFEEGNIFIGCDKEPSATTSYLKDSYIDEVRILNGYCEWTRNFTVPTNQYNYD